eukprot:SM000163S02306  [mRNA]  locus=s163:54973:55236:- [translate_table: standard]
MSRRSIDAGKQLFKAFILRSQVLTLYRKALRVARRAPRPQRGELKALMREEMDQHRATTDTAQIRHLLSDALLRLKVLGDTLHSQGH